ncbi:ETX/MTX2 family pore-forming toxin [Lysinibacillus sp. NPDC056220]|uniref:ETX/MTX2 family pore-forming toxin n=1 Tax=Lysinibacillus sp. NPDC056220 TaxID=3398580 RepID=UPI003BF59BD4
MGENTFINNLEQEQTFNITSFSESITKSTSITTKGKVGIPFVAEGEVSAILEFNLSTTISTTSTITANSQAVKVPPNKIYRHLSKQK